MSSELHLGLVKLGTMFPLEEDLISANAGDDRRVQQLRQLLLSQLDLIQKQSEAIVTKDNHIKELKRENEVLKKKVTSLEKSAAATSNKKTTVVVKESVEKSQSSTNTKIKKHEEIKQELDQNSNDDSIDNNDDESADSTEDVCMETVEPYFTLQHGHYCAGAGVNEDDIEMQKKAEVPGWRIKPISASYIMEGTENVEDSNLLKRHQKPENDEKRRKRWDVQRIREQRHVARLRARYDPSGGDADQSTSSALLINNANILNLKLIPEASKESLDIKTLLPNPDEAIDILVQETIPVSVFGSVLPKLNSKDFSLPWIN